MYLAIFFNTFKMSQKSNPSSPPRDKSASAASLDSKKSRKPSVKEVPSRFLTSNPRLEREKKVRQDSARPVSKSVVKLTPCSTERASLESADISTLPSTRSKKFLPKPSMKPLKQEVRELENLSSLLLQWSYANCLAEQAYHQQSERANEEMYDRGKQILDLKSQIINLRAEVKAKEETKLLDSVLSLEYSSLKSIEEDLNTVSGYLEELETAAYNTMNRLPLGEDVVVDPSSLLESINQAAHTLNRITDLVNPDSQTIEGMLELLCDFGKTLEDEREEVAKSYILLDELSKLYNEEKSLVADSLQVIFKLELPRS